MPVHTFRCACGKQADVLVRPGRRPPSTCDEVGEFGFCAAPGALTQALSAPFIASGATGPKSAPDSTCGHCGQVPGSCQTDN